MSKYGLPCWKFCFRLKNLSDEVYYYIKGFISRSRMITFNFEQPFCERLVVFEIQGAETHFMFTFLLSTCEWHAIIIFKSLISCDLLSWWQWWCYIAFCQLSYRYSGSIFLWRWLSLSFFNTLKIILLCSIGEQILKSPIAYSSTDNLF